MGLAQQAVSLNGPTPRSSPRSGGAETTRGRPPLRTLAWVQAAHAAGDALVAVALADTLFFSVPIGEARHQVALYLAITMAPFAILSPVVGPWLDRWAGSYRVAIVASAVGRVVLAVVLTGRTDTFQLFPLAFGLLVLSRVHGVSRSALVPEAIPPGGSLIRANSALAVISVIGAAAGAGPAVLLNHLIGPDASLWAAAVVFGAGAVVSVGLPGARGRGRRREATPSDVRALLSPRLLAGGVAMAAMRAAVGYVTFLFAFLVRAEGEGQSGLAVAVAAAGLGGFVGSVLAPTLRVVLRESLLLLVALGAVGATALWAAGDFDLTAAAVVAGVVGAASATGRLAFDSLVQRDAPEAVRGRTFTRYETILQLTWVAGAAVGTAIPLRAREGMWILAALTMGAAVMTSKGLMRRPRRRRPRPQPS